jgi:hypothetical protein
MYEVLMWIVVGLTVVLGIFGIVALFKAFGKYDDNTTKWRWAAGIALALTAIMIGVLFYLDNKWKDDLIKLAQDVDHFSYVSPVGAVSKEAAEKAVAAMGIWVPKDILNTMTSDKRTATKTTDKFLDALAAAADKPVKYVNLS